MTKTIKKRIATLEQQTIKTGWSPKQMKELAKNLQGGAMKMNADNTQLDYKYVPENSGTPRTGRKRLPGVYL